MRTFWPGLVVKSVRAVELRVPVAVVIAAATDSVLVGHHLPKLYASLAIALARLHVQSLAQKKSSLEAGRK
jgi:hypothetical protein